ncbi:hypothetical protein L2E82_50821 [Cichorium intybus]|nr:hypothetical protein L2E82_50821 [Cichorium intybus]
MTIPIGSHRLNFPLLFNILEFVGSSYDFIQTLFRWKRRCLFDLMPSSCDMLCCSRGIAPPFIEGHLNRISPSTNFELGMIYDHGSYSKVVRAKRKTQENFKP